MSANKVSLSPKWKKGTTANSITNTNTGNVGIGTTAPGAKLDVNGNILTSGTVKTTVGGSSGTGTQQLSSELYVQSRGMNLVTNGSGLLGNNYNFSSFTFDQTDTHGGKGSFRNATYNANVESNELIPVDGTRTYKLSLWAKSTTHSVGAHAYFGVDPYDIDGLSVSTVYYLRIAGTDTTLSQQLNPGDTVIHLTSGTNWSNSSAAYNRQIQIFDYANSFGYVYPAYTYSRHTSYNYANYVTNGAWAIGGASGDTITLTEAWPASLGTVPIGTAVSNGSAGSSYKYIAASNVDIPQAWTNYNGVIGGWDTAGSGAANLFPYGTSALRLLFLMNRDVAGNVTNVSDLWFSELTANNIEVASATQQGVVALGNQQMGTGNKYFMSNVGIGTTGPGASLDIHNSSDKIGLQVQGFSTQTNNLQEWLSSVPTVLTHINRDGTLDIGIATGTAPLVIASTTVVTNLNADLHDGLHSTDLPNIKQNISLTAQTGAIGATNITGTNTVGLYRVSYSLLDTTADLAAGTIMVNFAGTDEAGSTTTSSVALPLTAVGRTSGILYIRVLGTGSIQYSTTLVGIIGSSQYALFITCEKLL